MGARKGTSQQQPWRRDAAILKRMADGARLRSQGLTAPEIAAELGVSEFTVHEDRRRLFALREEDVQQAAEEAKAARAEHIENLRQFIRECHRELERLVMYRDEDGEITSVTVKNGPASSPRSRRQR